ncbi:MAG: hypothetical protein EPN98_21700 [Phenylobacterium sp.]|uniref:hypothetical protein n=1 Tax=Phenylobacterium sp. TaxID=1871053 RepID=UPI0011FBCA70|nr:hypothetical protein [Phenylobacterium sp.]TAL29059.1 MAG: hypothetical protein EPN98_21700 [Phenylobacterium sp.]
MTTEGTEATEQDSETKEARAWCRSVSAPDDKMYLYVHRPTDKADGYCISVHGPGVMAQFRSSETLLRELHRVIGDALFGEVEERDDTDEERGVTT